VGRVLLVQIVTYFALSLSAISSAATYDTDSSLSGINPGLLLPSDNLLINIKQQVYAAQFNGCDSGLGLVHVADHETGNLSQWFNNTVNMAQGRIVDGSSGVGSWDVLTTASGNPGTGPTRARGGNYFLQLTRREQDDFPRSGAVVLNNRVEVSLAGRVYSKVYTDRWMGMSMWVPPEYKNDTQWHVIAQWHTVNRSTRPSLALELYGEDSQIVVARRHGLQYNEEPSQEYDFGPTMPKGQWVDFVVHVYWDPDPEGDGLVDVWMMYDGDSSERITHKLTTYRGPIGYSRGEIRVNHWNNEPAVNPLDGSFLYEGDHYFKMGSYSARQTPLDRTFYFDEIRLGNSAAQFTVDPANCNY